MGGGRGCGACGGTDRRLTWFKLLLFCSCDDSGVVGMTTTWGVAADVGASAGANIASAASANIAAGTGADIVAGAGGGDALSCP